MFKKLPPIKKDDLHIGCLTCSTASLEAHPQLMLNVGFGVSHVVRNGTVFIDVEALPDGDFMFLDDVEKIASRYPDDDWRIVRVTPLHGETYQRQDGKWICVESNEGFA